jgi:hypothetical protein
MSETVKVEAGARHGRPNVKIAALPLAAITDMHAEARVRNTKTDAELAALLGIPGAAPYNAGATVTGNIALDFANGSSQKLTLTGSTLARSITPAPTN